MIPVLVLGSGLLGSALFQLLPQDRFKVTFASRKATSDCLPLDICDKAAVSRFFKKNGPWQVIINCAALSNVDQCEREPEIARENNALAIKNLAEACNAMKAGLMHVSTDYVFSGKSNVPYDEGDATGPCQIYGMTKLEGEFYAEVVARISCVIRTTWIFGGQRIDFVNSIREKIKEGESLKIVADQTASPTYVGDLGNAMMRILEVKMLPAVHEQHEKHFLYHVTNSGETTRHAMATLMAKLLKKTIQIDAIPSSEIESWDAVRPQFSVLSNQKLTRECGVEMRPWQEAMKEYLTA